MTTDNDVYTQLYSILAAGMTARGYTSATVRQGNADRITPAPDGQAIIFTMLNMRSYGYPTKQDTWDSDGSVMTHTETQKWLQMYQISAMSPDAYGDSDAPSAADLCRAAHGVMQADSTISTLYTAGIEIYRITEMRQLAVKNDKDAFEYVPSFDFTLSFDESYSETITSTSEIAGTLNGV